MRGGCLRRSSRIPTMLTASCGGEPAQEPLERKEKNRKGNTATVPYRWNSHPGRPTQRQITTQPRRAKVQEPREMRVSQPAGELHGLTVQWPSIRPGLREKSLVTARVASWGVRQQLLSWRHRQSEGSPGWAHHACGEPSELASLGQSQELQP